MELNKNIGSKSLHHFVQRLLVRSAMQTASRKATGPDDVPAELFKAAGQHWTECTEYVWRSGKLVSGQRNGRSQHSSHFPRKRILKVCRLLYQVASQYVDAACCYRPTIPWSVGRSVILVSRAKTAEPIEIPSGLRTWVGPRKHVLRPIHTAHVNGR